MYISIFNLCFLVILGFVIGYFAGDFYGKTFMNDMFCIFLMKQKNKEDLMQRYKDFLNEFKIKHLEKSLEKDIK